MHLLKIPSINSPNYPIFFFIIYFFAFFCRWREKLPSLPHSMQCKNSEGLVSFLRSCPIIDHLDVIPIRKDEYLLLTLEMGMRAHTRDLRSVHVPVEAMGVRIIFNKQLFSWISLISLILLLITEYLRLFNIFRISYACLWVMK